MSALDWSAGFELLAEGQRFRSRGRTITEADLVSFAALTGDWHPQHTDAEWAAGSRFGERIAHGMLIVSYAVGLVPFDPDRVLALRRIEDVTFKRPAKLGDTIHVEGRIAKLAPLNEDAALVGWRWDVRNQAGQLLCRAAVEVLWASETTATEDEPHPADLLDLPQGVLPC